MGKALTIFLAALAIVVVVVVFVLSNTIVVRTSYRTPSTGSVAPTCAAEPKSHEEYMKLLEKGLHQAFRDRDPFSGLAGEGGFAPVAGLDKPEAIPFLARVLKNGIEQGRYKSHSTLAKCYAALCLAKTGDEKAIEMLVEAAKVRDESDPDHNVACYSVTALGMMKNRKSVGPLHDFLVEDDREYVRVNAAWSLGKILDRTDSEYEELEKMSEEDKSEQVKKAAKEALAKIEKRAKEKNESSNPN